MEKIIRPHIDEGNNIIIDGWGSNFWMNDIHTGYNRIIHIHGHHVFGQEEESTAHIESVW